jgi:hypothetical protein
MQSDPIHRLHVPEEEGGQAIFAGLSRHIVYPAVLCFVMKERIPRLFGRYRRVKTSNSRMALNWVHINQDGQLGISMNYY